MAYKGFTRPEAARGSVTTGFWTDWMREQSHILIPVAPHHAYSCERCYGASGYRDDGEVWPVCWHCRRYGDVVNTFVPIVYSVDAGLESMLHRYKDRGIDWLQRPLASLLTRFVRGHADCIDRDARGIDIATVVPSDNEARPFNHLEALMHGITGDPVLNRYDWNFEAIKRNRGTARPSRGELKSSAYRVETEQVDGAAVLLLDDTWTSGSSASSAAKALKEAGAAHVTVLTLGRQLNAGNHFGSSDRIYADRHQEEWDPTVCVLCARPRF